MFFTIITATRNAAATLPRLLDSLAAQTCRDFELIIQDGASTDGTVGLAEAYRDRLPALSLDSAPDRGIYDAWNKALGRIQGEWVLFLGADDELAGGDTLESCRQTLSLLDEKICYAGGIVARVASDGSVASHVPFAPAAVEKMQWRHMPFAHQGLWHRNNLFDGCTFDASLRIAGDYDLVCRTWTPENGSHVLPFVVTKMYRGGVSDSPQSILRIRWENAAVSSRYFPNVWTFSCLSGLMKGGLVRLICAIFGARAPIVLDAGRRLRGLPPAWKEL
ncbi:MAG: glycosyltransferase [Desulfovibrio sp.]|jgi:glycosyltransferase involved in cell wall biosynthesis|nr:glycosyltransferase [Desulfovibrio sp.]